MKYIKVKGDKKKLSRPKKFIFWTFNPAQKGQTL